MKYIKYFKYIVLMVIVSLLVILIYEVNVEKKEIFKKKNVDALYISKQYMISEDNVFRKISINEANKMIKNKDGIIFIGNKEDISRKFVKVFNDVIMDDSIEVISYIDKIDSIKKDSKEYKNFIELIKDDTKLEKNGDEYILNLPMVIFIKDGKIVDYYNARDDFSRKLSNDDKIELKIKIDEKIRKVYSNKCEEAC